MSAWKIYTFALRWRIGYKLFAVSIVSLLAQLLSYQGKPKRLSLLRIISRSRLALPRKDVWSHRFICYFVKAYSQLESDIKLRLVGTQSFSQFTSRQ